MKDVSQDLEGELRELYKLPAERAVGECLESAFEDYQRAATDRSGKGVFSPLFVGLLASRILAHPGASKQAKIRACWAVFDVIPLPEREDEAFVTSESVPPGLQEAARYLIRQDEFMEYHLLHMIYALYLDPERACGAPFTSLEQNLSSITSGSFDEGLKLLYAYLLLSSPSLSPNQAQHLFTALLDSPAISEEPKRFLCLSSVDSTFSVGWFVTLAAREGLYPREPGSQEELMREVRVRPLPQTLSPSAEEWLLRLDAGVRKPSSGEGGL